MTWQAISTVNGNPSSGVCLTENSEIRERDTEKLSVLLRQPRKRRYTDLIQVAPEREPVGRALKGDQLRVHQ